MPSITPGQGLYVSLDQQRPLLVFITLAIISGSSPKRIPRFVASETPIMLTASNRLLQILAAYKVMIDDIFINKKKQFEIVRIPQLICNTVTILIGNYLACPSGSCVDDILAHVL